MTLSNEDVVNWDHDGANLANRFEHGGVRISKYITIYSSFGILSQSKFPEAAQQIVCPFR